MTLKCWNYAKLLCQALFAGVSAGIVLYSPNASAAEQVILKYGDFRGTISVKELNQFVQTGETTSTLRAYLQASGQNQALARKALTAKIKADTGFLNRLLSSWAGPILLDQFGEVVHPPSNPADSQGIRSALTRSIKKDGEVTLLKTIQYYPTSPVELEGDRLIPVYKRLSGLAKMF